MSNFNNHFNIIKECLEEIKQDSFPLETKFLPILHNKDVIFLQFNGWSINLYRDGTYLFEDTTGG